MKDFIIVGAGLGGSCIAYRLEKRRKTFIVFDDESQKASKVAGGLMNPVVLKRFTMARKADEQMQKAKRFYGEMEEALGKAFLSPLDLYRRFYSIEEQNNWFTAADRPGMARYLDTNLVPGVNQHIPGKFSFGRVLNTSRLDLRCLLESYSGHLQEKGMIRKETFDYDQLEISTSGVRYKNISAKNVIFCEGFGLLKNPFFNYLPLRGNKGEYIIIKAPGLDLEVGIKSSIFIFPAGRDHYMVGATYNNKDKTPAPTTSAREELVGKLKDLLKIDFEIVDQVAGLRPSTIDRMPMIGQHPEHKNLYICNGFGSRGILIAPSVSQELLDFIENNKPFDPQADISRFTAKWFKKV